MCSLTWCQETRHPPFRARPCSEGRGATQTDRNPFPLRRLVGGDAPNLNIHKPPRQSRLAVALVSLCSACSASMLELSASFHAFTQAGRRRLSPGTSPSVSNRNVPGTDHPDVSHSGIGESRDGSLETPEGKCPKMSPLTNKTQVPQSTPLRGRAVSSPDRRQGCLGARGRTCVAHGEDGTECSGPGRRQSTFPAVISPHAPRRVPRFSN